MANQHRRCGGGSAGSSSFADLGPSVAVKSSSDWRELPIAKMTEAQLEQTFDELELLVDCDSTEH